MRGLLACVLLLFLISTNVEAKRWELTLACDLPEGKEPTDDEFTGSPMSTFLIYPSGVDDFMMFGCEGGCAGSGGVNADGFPLFHYSGGFVASVVAVGVGTTASPYMVCAYWRNAEGYDTYQEAPIMTTGWTASGSQDVKLEMQRQSDTWFSILLVGVVFIGFIAGWRMAFRGGDQ